MNWQHTLIRILYMNYFITYMVVALAIMVHNSRIVVGTFHQPTSNPSSWTMPLLKSAMLDTFPDVRCSGLGLVPKHDGGWHTIYHLSAPHGSSINDYINPDDYTLSYCSVDDAYAILNLLGTGALMSKVDLKNVFL